MVLPAINAEPERCFSNLKLFKTLCRTRMNQKRLNNILLINDHKEEAKKICLDEVTEDFVLRKEGHRSEFGVKRNN